MDPIILFAPIKILLQHSEDEWLSSLGGDSLIYSDRQGEGTLRELFPKMRGMFRLFDNYSDSPLIELDALSEARRLNIKIVVALAEVDLLRAARVRDRLNDSLTCYERTTLFYRDKFMMKQCLAQHGIRVMPMSVVNSACELDDFLKRHEFPVVIKPRDGRGSGGVKVLKSRADVTTYLQEQPGTTFFNLMVEKYIDAPLLNVNGLYINGAPIIISPVRSTITCLDFLEGESLGLQMLSPSNPLHGRCIELTRTIIERALPQLQNMLFHLEIFVDGEDLIVCEIACRLGGCSVNQELKEAYGIDSRLALISAERGGPALSKRDMIKPKRLVGQLNMPPSKGRLTALPDRITLPFIRYCLVTAKKGETYSGMALTNGEILSAIVEGENEDAVSANLMQLDSWARSEFVWD